MKWITAAQLERWAETLTARAQLPALINALHRASAHQISTIRFPAEEKSQVHGFDGHLVGAGVSFVQDGESFWELGTSDDYLGKANKDFKDRSEDTPPEKRATSSFVFVTPRTWNKSADDENELQKWRERKRREGGWKEVVVIDGVMLEDWLEQCPPVAARYARYHLGLVPKLGARSTDEYWDEWTSRFKVAPSEQLLLCERDQARAEVLKRLRSGPGPLELRADSPDEAIAFAIAAIRAADPEVREFLESRTIVIDSDEAARELATRKDLIFIPRNVTITGQLARQAPTLIAVGRDRPERESYVRLDRPTSHAFAEALQGMGLSEETANVFSRSCGRSVTGLMRLFPNGDVGVPQWAKPGTALVPALLAGAWDSASEEDKKVLCKLSGADTYETYEAELRQFQRMDDPPIDREGTIWKMRAPVVAFLYLGHLLGNENFSRLKDVVVEMFSEIDPSLSVETPPKAWEQPKRRYSSWLRDGLATTLLQIAVNHEGASLQIAGTTPQAFVDELVKSLPGLFSDARVIASLRNELPLLMEAAPRPFLNALNRLVHGDGSFTIPIFKEGDFFSPFSPHTYLLWGLEVLAWDPQYLREVSVILAKLAKIDPGGTVSNRPINTLLEIFLPWHPSTNASQEQRFAALDFVIREVPEVAWALTSKLLPTMHSVGQYTAKPKYREAGGSERERLTRGMVIKAYETIVEKAFSLADGSAERWSYLVRDFTNFGPALRSKMCVLLEAFLETAPEKEQQIVWEGIRDEVNRHVTYKQAQWALPEAELRPLSRLVERFEPSDPIARAAWLFDEQFPEMPGADRDPEKAINTARQETLDSLVSELGLEAILNLAERVKLPHTLAFALPLLNLDTAAYDFLLDLALKNGKEKTFQFAEAISGAAARQLADKWHKVFLRRVSENELSIEQIASLLQYWPDVRSTWEFAASLGPAQEGAYWSRKPAWPIRGNSDDLVYAALRYVKAGRCVDAIQSLGEEAATLPPEVVFGLLKATVNELNENPRAATGMFTYYVERILDRLEKGGAATTANIAEIEWTLLPLFDYGRRNLRIYRIMAEDPNFYVSLISAVFRAEGEQPTEPTPVERARATAAYRLLSSFGEVPGQKTDTVDAERLAAWVREVQRLGQEAGRSGMTNEYIGHVLAHALADTDDEAWPHRAIRDILENLNSDEVERGLNIERFNIRGVYSKVLFEGGKQERTFAAQYRDWAAKCDAWPRTQKMLREIAQEWDRHAAREDSEARKERMRIE